jgi:hypothetical protein
MSEQIVDGQSRQVWWNTDGKTVIESFTIADMSHGTPLSSLGSGIAGPCMIEAGISSSDHIAKFFELNEPRIEAPAKRRVPLFEAFVKNYAPPSHSRREILAGCERKHIEGADRPRTRESANFNLVLKGLGRESKWLKRLTQDAPTRVTLDRGHPRRGRAVSKPGHVRCAPIATKFRIATE